MPEANPAGPEVETSECCDLYLPILLPYQPLFLFSTNIFDLSWISKYYKFLFEKTPILPREILTDQETSIFFNNYNDGNGKNRHNARDSLFFEKLILMFQSLAG